MNENDLGPLFRLPDDPHYLWIVGVAVAALAIAVLAVGLLRGRLPSTLLLPALGLPLAAWGIGYLHTLEESKQVSFCGSCHETMSPLVAALAEDDDTIASSHFRRGAVPNATACYECHSGYGLWGGVDAKLAGLRHMLLTVTGGYELPLQSHRFDNAACLGCHALAVPFAEVEDHRDPDTQAELLSGETSCAGICHDDAHPESALWGVAGPPATGGR